jgi:hypothetical protein
MCSLQFFAMIRRRDQEIIQFYTIHLGWIVSGNILLTAPEEVPWKSLFTRNNDNLDQQLQRFWEIEALPNKTWAAEKILCEEHFKKHTVRNDRTLHCETFSTRKSRPFWRVVWTSKAKISTARATVPGTSRFASGIVWIYARIWRTGSYEPD